MWYECNLCEKYTIILQTKETDSRLNVLYLKRQNMLVSNASLTIIIAGFCTMGSFESLLKTIYSWNRIQGVILNKNNKIKYHSLFYFNQI